MEEYLPLPTTKYKVSTIMYQGEIKNKLEKPIHIPLYIIRYTLYLIHEVSWH